MPGNEKENHRSDDAADERLESSGHPLEKLVFNDTDDLGLTIVSNPSPENREPNSEPENADELGRTVLSPLFLEKPASGPGHTVLINPREQPQEFGFLFIQTGTRRGEIHRLDSPRNVVGRERGVQIFVDDPHVSGHHASIRCEYRPPATRGEFVLRDLDSENGTWINGNKITGELVLKDGDIIEVGKTQFVFKKI